MTLFFILTCQNVLIFNGFTVGNSFAFNNYQIIKNESEQFYHKIAGSNSDCP